jgi:hypothetical protein
VPGGLGSPFTGGGIARTAASPLLALSSGPAQRAVVVIGIAPDRA